MTAKARARERFNVCVLFGLAWLGLVHYKFVSSNWNYVMNYCENRDACTAVFTQRTKLSDNIYIFKVGKKKPPLFWWLAAVEKHFHHSFDSSAFAQQEHKEQKSERNPKIAYQKCIINPHIFPRTPMKTPLKSIFDPQIFTVREGREREKDEQKKLGPKLNTILVHTQNPDTPENCAQWCIKRRKVFFFWNVNVQFLARHQTLQIIDKSRRSYFNRNTSCFHCEWSFFSLSIFFLFFLLSNIPSH